MHRITIKVKGSYFRDKIRYHLHDKDMVETCLFWPDNPEYLLSNCGNQVHKNQGFIIFFVSLDETMDIDREVNGISLLFSESAFYEAIFI